MFFFNFDLSYVLLYWMFVYCRSVYLKIYTFPERFIVYKFRQLRKQVQLKKQVNYNTSGKVNPVVNLFSNWQKL